MEDVEDWDENEAEDRRCCFLLLSLLLPLLHSTPVASHEFVLDDEIEDWISWTLTVVK